MKNKENTLGANKQMAFLNTTKLAVLSAMLLLVVFCTIGMSFTPAEEGENIGNPNDSTYVTGPRKLHGTTTSSCGGTNYHHEKDEATVTAYVDVKDYEGDVAEVGTVTLDFEKVGDYTIVESPSSNGTKEATIKWTCGVDQNVDENILKANHKLKVIFTASEPKKEGYIFVGWFDEFGIIASESLSFPKTITIGANDEKTDGILSYVQGEQNPGEYSYTEKYYARYEKQQEEFSVRFESAKGDGSYTYQIGETTYTVPKEGKEETLHGKTSTTLVATVNNDIFWGWYVSYDGGNTYGLLSKSSELIHTFDRQAIVYAQFIPNDAALFIIQEGDGTEYWNLNEACEKAKSSDLKVVLPKADGTLYPLVDGELCTNPEGKTIQPYTIPIGVTLLVPYDSNAVVSTNSPEIVVDGNTNPTPFRTLELSNNTILEVKEKGSICVNSKLRDRQNSNGAQNGKCGMINMQEGSTITLNSGANLYCWGIIYGKGEITANSGATVYESFQVNDYPGGTIMAPDIEILGQKLNPNGQYQKFIDHNVFPVRIFCFPNIQSKLHLHYGATEKVATAFANLGLQKDIIFISKSEGLFTISSEGSSVTKWYDINEDLQHFELRGDANLKSVQFTAGVSAFTADVNSANYILPFTHNMRITLLPKENGKGVVNITEDIAILPGAKIYIDKDVTVKIAQQKRLYIYDQEEWSSKYTATALNTNSVNNNFSIIYGRTTTNRRSYKDDSDDLQDAVLEVAGSIEVNGALYTTSHGADIKGIDDGKVVFVSSPQNSPDVYQFIQSSITYEDIPTNPAWLHNGSKWYGEDWKNNEWYNKDINLEYLETKDCDANTIRYANHHWGWMEIWKDHNGTLKINNTCAKVNNSSAYTPEGLTNFIGWSTEIDETNQEVIHTVLYSFGPELDIADADGANLTINANGWASTGWPYTINGTEYGKDDKAEKEKYRKADRTLTVPYIGDTNDEMAIVVTKTGGEIVSSHIYKVFVYNTSNATLSGTDENRIVFVKSGTLSIEGDASAKEIYVAPGAELKVTGTLTVGKLVLRTTPWQSAVLTNNGTINGQVYYSRISPDSEQYYQFGLPLSCALANVKMSNTGKLGGSQPKYGTAWMLKSYSESSRAEKGIREDGANWTLLKNIDNTGVITAGVGYEMFSNSNYYREFYFPVDITTATTQVSVQYTDGTIGAEHNGWNIITSLLTSKATVTIGDPATAIKVCWLQTDGTYKQELPTVFPPAIPFSIQTSAEGKLNFAIPTIAAAPRKQSAAEALTETEWVHLDIYDTYGEGDETSLFVHPTRFEQTYKTGIDVAKQSLTAARPIIYSTHAYGDMAFAGIADSLLENGIDLAVYSPVAQELTFSLRENKFLHRLEYLWLADNETGARTDLLMDDYTCRANAGTAKGRFVLNGRFKAPQIATGIGNTQTDYNIYAIGNNIAISGVEQGTPIYVFDAVGHMIYTTAATSDEVIVPAPCAGVYMLSVGGQTAKLVINK